MTHKQRARGGALVVAIIAMAAMASSASAANFTSGANTTNIKGTQVATIVLTVTGQTVSCTSTTFAGEATGTSLTQITVKPTYTGCTGLGGAVEAKVTGFGHYGEASTCDYLIKASGVMDLVCAAGAEVTYDVGTCQIHIPAQTNIGKITHTLTTGANGRLAWISEFEISFLTGTHTDGFLCPFNGSGSFTNGILDGDAIFEGTNAVGGAAVDISFDA